MLYKNKEAATVIMSLQWVSKISKKKASKMANASLTPAFIVLTLHLLLSAAMEAATRAQLPTTSICKSLVEIQGYTCQEHNVTTKDGYILGLQRIPMGRSANNKTETNNKRRPVLLQHGLFLNVASWVVGSPNESLAFILADNGFDVWLSNTRGTAFSRRHISLGDQDAAFWEWSWDELADYDLPALFQYVQDQTGQKLHYVGHSLGTLIAIGAFSKGKLFNMLRSVALLSPIAYLGHIPSLGVRIPAELFSPEALYLLGVREFIPNSEEVTKLFDFKCNKLGIECSTITDIFGGPNCCIKTSTLNSYLEHEPQSTATKNLIHLGQMIRMGNIAKYDYGNEDDNVEHYGQPTPPAYNISSIPKEVPLFISYGGRDTLFDVEDVKILFEDLRDHDADKLLVQYREDYAHFDFVLASNANRLVFDPLRAFFRLH